MLGRLRLVGEGLPQRAHATQHTPHLTTDPSANRLPLPAWVTNRSGASAAETCATGYNPLFQAGSEGAPGPGTGTSYGGDSGASTPQGSAVHVLRDSGFAAGGATQA